MNCIILGDKYQKGMKSKGCSGLIKINKNTHLIENQYEVLKNLFPDINIIYIYGFDNKKFIEYIEKTKLDITIQYNEKYNEHGQVFSLRSVKTKEYSDTLIIDGYKKLTKKTFNNFDESRGSQIFISNEISKGDQLPGCIINQDSINHFSYDLHNTIQDIYYLDKKCFEQFCLVSKDKYYYNSFIFEILNKIIDKGYRLKPLLVDC